MVMDLQVVDRLLTTTRSVRLRLDLEKPVEPEIIQECLEIAIQAPTGSNAQNWHFLVVTDPAKKDAIAKYYRRAFRMYVTGRNASMPRGIGSKTPLSQVRRVLKSANYLAKVIGRVPVLVIPCIAGRPEKGSVVAQASAYGSIIPAAWSLMLALRARGLGSSWTTLHLMYEKEVAEILAIPKNITQAALLPVAYFSGEDFKPARRTPASQCTYWNVWEETKE